MINLHDKHIQLVEIANDSKTRHEHDKALTFLQGWRTGVGHAAGVRTLSYMACDQHYLDQGINRPMCCGIWLDWKPAED